MIVKREFYKELWWLEWARLRLVMAWGRLSGAMRRELTSVNAKGFAREAAQMKAEAANCARCGGQHQSHV